MLNSVARRTQVEPTRPARDDRRLTTPWHKRDLVLVLTIMALALLLRLYDIGAAGLWTDEAGSIWMARHSPPAIWHWVTAIENKPPLYYWLLHFWLAAGDREGTLRLMSALCGTLQVPIAYAIGHVLGGRSVAVITALFLSISPINVHYSQEARMYTLLALAASVSILGQACLLKRPESVAAPAWLAYVFGTAAALWVQYPAVFLPIAANIIVLSYTRHLPCKRQFMRNWIVAQGLVVALCSPLIPLYIHQSSAQNLPPPQTLDPVTIMGGLIFDIISVGGSYLAFVPIAALQFELATIALGLILWAGNRRWAVFVIGLWLIPFVGEILISLLWRPVFAPRTLIWTTIPFYLIVASALSLLQRRPGYRAAGLAAFMLMAIAGLASNYWTKPEYEAWRPVAAYVAQRIRPGDIILFNDNHVELPFDYYFRADHGFVVERGVPNDFLANFKVEPQMTGDDVPMLQGLVRNYPRAWLVYSHQWYTDPRGLIPESLRQVARLVDHQAFASREPIAVFLYERQP